MLNLDSSQLRALKLRFTQSFTDGRQIVHHLPNGLYVLTLDPNFAKTISSIMLFNAQIGSEIQRNTVYCQTDKGDLLLPLDGAIIDLNEEITESIPLFVNGLTSSFTVILKPAKDCEPLSDSFYSLF